MEHKNGTPVLFPMEPSQFWLQIRMIIREEIKNNLSKKGEGSPEMKTPGLIEKPLYKISEVCSIFAVTRPTIYEWIKLGKLKPYKIRSRVYFLWNDIELLIKPLR